MIKHKKWVSSISLLLAMILLFSVATPAFSAESTAKLSVENTIETIYEDYTVPVQPDGNAIQEYAAAVPSVYEDGVILIYHYQQLMLIGTGAALTDTDYLSDGLGGGEAVVTDDGEAVVYGLDSDYRIVRDIALPRHTVWRLPQNFGGSIAGEAAEETPLYDESSDTVYVYHPYQLAVMAAEDASIQPVMSGDADASAFGS